MSKLNGEAGLTHVLQGSLLDMEDSVAKICINQFGRLYTMGVLKNPLLTGKPSDIQSLMDQKTYF